MRGVAHRGESAACYRLFIDAAHHRIPRPCHRRTLPTASLDARPRRRRRIHGLRTASPRDPRKIRLASPQKSLLSPHACQPSRLACCPSRSVSSPPVAPRDRCPNTKNRSPVRCARTCARPPTHTPRATTSSTAAALPRAAGCGAVPSTARHATGRAGRWGLFSASSRPARFSRWTITAGRSPARTPSTFTSPRDPR